MKIDFQQIHNLALKFRHDFLEDGDTFEQLDKGSMVYSINFDPTIGTCNVHVQWPYFRNLVANEADCPATYSVNRSVEDGESWIHWTCSVPGVTINACMDKSDVLRELKSLKLPEDCVSDDIETLLKLWMNVSGWNMEVSR